MGKTVIVAGNHRQFEYYMKQHGLSRNGTIYASSADRLRGLRGCEVILVGEHWKSPIREYRGFRQLLRDIEQD